MVWPFFAPSSSFPMRVTTFKTFPLAEAADAHRLMESGHQRGKILLQV